jgi:hypothetical protein
MNAPNDLSLRQPLMLMKYDTAVANSRTDSQPVVQRATSGHPAIVTVMECERPSLDSANARDDRYRFAERPEIRQRPLLLVYLLSRRPQVRVSCG